MRGVIILPLLFFLVHADLEKSLDWWQTTVFYQIYPRSFMDSDGDGIGDLNGITSKLDYLKDLGIGAIWLSPIFKSPMYDFGYDISDFYAIQDEYGTMEDFENLLHNAKERDIKVILDFVPNHSSNESVWFQEALKGHNKYFDYFMWEDGVKDENGVMHPPNNWVSVFRKSAWEYRPEVGKYYLHQFVIGQPDLNYRNPDVVDEMKNVIRFWLNKGIAGFRVDAIAHLFEIDKDLYGGKYPDEPLTHNTNDVDSYSYTEHIYTKNQEETYDMVYQWREVFDEYKTADGMTRVMMTECYDSPEIVMKYFGDGNREGAQMPFNFALIGDINRNSSAYHIKYALEKFMTYKPVDKMANWVAGNHDNSRVATRFRPELVDGINMLVTLLPGIMVTYMGEEIGMVDGYVSWEDTVDPSGCNTDDPINYWKSSRDPERTPFQWNADKNAGFSSADKTWLPVADGYQNLNVEYQQSQDRSHWSVYRSLVRLRAEPTFRYVNYESVALNQDVFAFRRWYKDEIYVIIINFRDSYHTVDLRYFKIVNGILVVVISNIQSLKIPGEYLEASTINMGPYDSLVLKVIRYRSDDKNNQLIDLKNFQFIINPSNVCKECRKRFLLVILVHSSLSNIKKRTAIRKTWGKPSDCIKVLYAMGASNNADVTNKIKEENEKYHDIVQGSFTDSYKNLTYKHVMVLKWATTYCHQAKYIIKVDDDIIVNIDLLYEKLSTDYWGVSNLIACVVGDKMEVLRNDSKWAVSKEEYFEDTYPDYCIGPFIIYSKDVASRLLDASYNAPYFWIDDVHVSGTLVKRIGLANLTNLDWSWFLENPETLLSVGPKNLEPFIFGPIDLEPNEIYKIWKALKG